MESPNQYLSPEPSFARIAPTSFEIQGLLAPALLPALGFPLPSSASRPEEMGTAAGAGGWARAARAAQMEDIRAKKRASEDPTQCIPSLGRGGGGFCGPNLALALTLGLQVCT